MQNLKHGNSLRHIHPIFAQLLNGFAHDAAIKLHPIKSNAHLDKRTVAVVEILARLRLGSEVV